MDIQQSFMNYGMGLYLYLTLLSTVGCIMMGWDKKKAENRKSRISENQLFFIAFLGGSAGIAFGMLIFKHKTSKKKFYIGIPGIYVLQWAFLFVMIYYGI